MIERSRTAILRGNDDGARAVRNGTALADLLE
jgi:hypothetical protein